MGKKIGLKNIENEIKGKDIVLLALSKADYSKKIAALAKIAAKQSKGMCYVSVNKPAKTLVAQFASDQIDTRGFRFIDCTGTGAIGGAGTKGAGDKIDIVFVSSPKNLTEISIAISNAMKGGKGEVFVDALSTFLIYDDGPTVLRFTHNIISKIRECGNKGFFVILKNDVNASLLDDLGMFVDGVAEV